MENYFKCVREFCKKKAGALVLGALAAGVWGYHFGNALDSGIPEQEQMQARHAKAPGLDSCIILGTLATWPFFYKQAKAETRKYRGKI